jgi:transposase
MVMSIIAHTGFDVHEVDVVVSVRLEGGVHPVVETRVPYTREAITELVKRLSQKYMLYCYYEASGCGFSLYRWLKELSIPCQVVAPSLIPQRPGDHIKTDKRDARKLSQLGGAGLLTAIYVPSEEQEADRSLVRVRETMVCEVVRSKNYIQKFLVLHNRKYTDGKKAWTEKYWSWIRRQEFTGSAATVWSEYISLLEYKLSRLKELTSAVRELANTDRYRELAQKLCSFRGIAIVTAMTILTEIGDFRRFANAHQLMSFLGLVPSENSSGGRRRLGSITKAGNAHVRRVIVEAAWKYQSKPAVGVELGKRQEGVDACVIAHSWKAQHRLHKKFWRIANKKEKVKAVVATARELAGFLWAVLTGRCMPITEAAMASAEGCANSTATA